ncbi:hypothetical protein V8C86DRAFT_3092521 [Haematococcus lacustris]
MPVTDEGGMVAELAGQRGAPGEAGELQLRPTRNLQPAAAHGAACLQDYRFGDNKFALLYRFGDNKFAGLQGQSKGKADPAAPPGELRGTWPAGVQPVHDAARAVYIQVKGARGLVKPQLHGLESTYSAHATVVV